MDGWMNGCVWIEVSKYFTGRKKIFWEKSEVVLCQNLATFISIYPPLFISIWSPANWSPSQFFTIMLYMASTPYSYTHIWTYPKLYPQRWTHTIVYDDTTCCRITMMEFRPISYKKNTNSAQTEKKPGMGLTKLTMYCCYTGKLCLCQQET